MKKRIVSIIVSLFFVLGMLLPCYAATAAEEAAITAPIESFLTKIHRDKNKTNPHLDQMKQRVEKIYPGTKGLDVGSIGSCVKGKTSKAVTDFPSDTKRILEDNLIRSVPYPVSNESELVAALADSSKDTIRITQDISLTSPLVISRSVTIIATTTKRIIAPSGQRHIEISNQSTQIEIVFSNVILDGNELGGGFEIVNSYVYIFGAQLVDCCENGNFSGEAILAFNISFTTVNNVTTGSISGGVVLEACYVEDCITSTSSVLSFGPLSATELSVIGNTDGSGIAVMNISSSTVSVYLEDIIVQGNESDSFGGGIVLIGVEAEIVGTLSTDSVTEEVTSTSIISGNTAQYGGGGIYSYLSDTEIEGAIIENNTCYYNGNYGNYEGIELGGAGVMSIGQLSLTDSYITGNHSNCIDASGVGVYAASTAAYSDNMNIDPLFETTDGIEITGCYINGNEGHYIVNNVDHNYYLYGSGLFLYGINSTITDSEIKQNTGAGIGGGICVLFEFGEDTPAVNWSNPDVTLSGVTIQGNSTSGMGGGAAFIGGYDENKQDNVIDAMSSLLITDETSINNNSSVFGGGIASIGFATKINGDSEVVTNAVEGDPDLDDDSGFLPSWSGAGGGVLLYESNLILLDAALSENEANPSADEEDNPYSAGGGVYAKHLSTVTISNSSFLAEENYADNGGALYLESAASLIMSNGTISNNSAADGAGMYAVGLVTINGGLITLNSAADNGGGIYSLGIVVIQNGTVSYNTADFDGGGIWSTGTINFNAGTISNNTAHNNGGGICSEADLNIYTGIISGNTAKRNGGGVYGKNVNFTVGGAGLVEGNHALGTVIGATSTKGRGGGLYIKDGVLAILSGYTTNIQYNNAKYAGGGVYLDNSLYYLYPVDANPIHDNTKGANIPSNMEP